MFSPDSIEGKVNVCFTATKNYVTKGPNKSKFSQTHVPFSNHGDTYRINTDALLIIFSVMVKASVIATKVEKPTHFHVLPIDFYTR